MIQQKGERARRILIIEDTHDIAEMLEMLLSAEGYEVSSTPSGVEGLVRFAREPFDLVLLDLQIDDLSGLGVERAIRDLAETPVVVMSAQLARYRGEVLRAGATACVPKPFEADDLLSLIATLLARRPGPPNWAGEVQELSPEDLDRIGRMSADELDALPFGIISVDAELRIDRYNDYEQSATGYPQERVLGKSLLEIAPCVNVREFVGVIEDGMRRRQLDHVLRYVFPHRSARSVVSIRLYYDKDHDRVFVIISRRASDAWLAQTAEAA